MIGKAGNIDHSKSTYQITQSGLQGVTGKKIEEKLEIKSPVNEKESFVRQDGDGEPVAPGKWTIINYMTEENAKISSDRYTVQDSGQSEVKGFREDAPSQNGVPMVFIDHGTGFDSVTRLENEISKGNIPDYPQDAQKLQTSADPLQSIEFEPCLMSPGVSVDISGVIDSKNYTLTVTDHGGGLPRSFSNPDFDSIGSTQYNPKLSTSGEPLQELGFEECLMSPQMFDIKTHNAIGNEVLGIGTGNQRNPTSLIVFE